MKIEFFLINSRLKISKKEKEKQKAEQQQAKNPNNFEIGTRVFHSKYGVGHIKDIQNIGASTIYAVDFGKLGIKNLDLTYSDLKTF